MDLPDRIRASRSVVLPLPAPSKDIFKTVLFQDKCGLEGTGAQFYEWCYKMQLNTTVQTKCAAIGQQHPSTLTAIYSRYTETDNKYPVYMDMVFDWTEEGVAKRIPARHYLDQDQMGSVALTCYLRRAFPSSPTTNTLGQPAWVILLIALSVLAALSISGFLSWKYFFSVRNRSEGELSVSSRRVTDRVEATRLDPTAVKVSKSEKRAPFVNLISPTSSGGHVSSATRKDRIPSAKGSGRVTTATRKGRIPSANGSSRVSSALGASRKALKKPRKLSVRGPK